MRAWASVLVLLVASCGTGPAEARSVRGTTPRQGEKDMDTLKQQVLKDDPAAAVRARQIGRKAAPMLKDLAKHAEAGVRETALNCLKETGGPEASQAALEALADDDVQVAAAAVGVLQKHYDPKDSGPLLAGYDKCLHPLVRQELALLVGRGDKAADLAGLKKRRVAEKEAEAAEGAVVALARLGDKESQEEFVRQLHASKERGRRRYLVDYVSYINAPWVLKPLLPLLDDKEVIVRIALDARPDLDVNLRTCDVVVNQAAKISGRKFAFKVEEYKTYSDAEVDEARRFLKGLP